MGLLKASIIHLLDLLKDLRVAIILSNPNRPTSNKVIPSTVVNLDILSRDTSPNQPRRRSMFNRHLRREVQRRRGAWRAWLAYVFAAARKKSATACSKEGFCFLDHRDTFIRLRSIVLVS